eukprot:12054958-Karenia_brevis.AAC.1
MGAHNLMILRKAASLLPTLSRWLTDRLPWKRLRLQLFMESESPKTEVLAFLTSAANCAGSLKRSRPSHTPT